MIVISVPLSVAWLLVPDSLFLSISETFDLLELLKHCSLWSLYGAVGKTKPCSEQPFL